MVGSLWIHARPDLGSPALGPVHLRIVTGSLRGSGVLDYWSQVTYPDLPSLEDLCRYKDTQYLLPED